MTSNCFQYCLQLINSTITTTITSTSYFFQYNETNPTAWRPYTWPIKVLMCVALVLMILQATAELCKDIALIKSEEK